MHRSATTTVTVTAIIMAALAITVQTVAVTSKDTRPPTVPGSINVTATTQASGTVAWLASTDAGGSKLAGYRLFRDNVTVTTVGATATSYTYTGLTAGTSYAVAIQAYDGAGNNSGLARTTLTTQPAPPPPGTDTTPPTQPGNLHTAGVTDTSVSLVWDASTDNVGVAGYRVSVGATLLATTSSTGYVAHGLKPATTYGFTVVAFDAAQNVSAPATQSVTTSSTPSPPPGGALVTDPNAVFAEPTVAKPGYLGPTTDTTFHTTVTRIAGDAGTPIAFTDGGTGTWSLDARQHYNDDQAWNADGSLLVLENRTSGGGVPEQVILDGNTYQAKHNKCPNYDNYDDRWLPTLAHKNERMNANGTTLEWFDVIACQQTRAWSLPWPVIDLAQNPSSDGRFAALSNGRYVFVIDMDPQSPYLAYPNKRVGPLYDLTDIGPRNKTVDFVEISPSAKYVIVHYDGDRDRILDVDPATLALKPHVYASTIPHPTSIAGYDPTNGFIFALGHPGVGFDPYDGNQEVYVGQLRDWDPQSVDGVQLGPVVMVRLSDGKITNLITAGNTASAYHISMVNAARPGWAYVSFWPSPGKRFSDEIIAVRLDGSGTVERLTHTHTDTETSNGYRSEAHPVPSRDGMRVLFASAWNYLATGGSANNPQAYVIDTRALR